jgi:hypothetical protein
MDAHLLTNPSNIGGLDDLIDPSHPGSLGLKRVRSHSPLPRPSVPLCWAVQAENASELLLSSSYSVPWGLGGPGEFAAYLALLQPIIMGSPHILSPVGTDPTILPRSTGVLVGVPSEHCL